MSEEIECKTEEKGGSKGLHLCEISECSKLFKDKRSWEEHMRFHKGEKPFTCDLTSCQKKFSRLSSLLKHKRIHEGNKPYRCKICNHTFTQSSNLRRHERIHSGEKPYSCEFCHKNFLTNSNLKQHKIIHMDLRNKFKCERCDRCYFYKSSLKKHLVSHDKESKRRQANNNTTTSGSTNDIIDCKEEYNCKMEEKMELMDTNAGLSPTTTCSPPPQSTADCLIDIVQKQLLQTNQLSMEINKGPSSLMFLKELKQQQSNNNNNNNQQQQQQQQPQSISSYGTLNEAANKPDNGFGNFMFTEQAYYEDMPTKQLCFEDNSGYYLESAKGFAHQKVSSYPLNQYYSKLYGNNNNLPKYSNNSDVLSEMDARDYKIIKAMQSKDLVFIDSDDEEEPVKQVKSCPVTYKTETMKTQNENNRANQMYGSENLFALESNYFKEKDPDMFIVEEKPANEIFDTNDFYNEF
jgi:hypothetical protein